MEIKFCNNCLAMSTRPRISFDNEGKCNACVWSIKKKKYNWSNNILKLNKYIKKIKKNNDNDYDCIVPVSGGKDGSYVYHNVKKKFIGLIGCGYWGKNLARDLNSFGVLSSVSDKNPKAINLVGKISKNIARVSVGTILLEINTYNDTNAAKALKKALHKLPLKTEIRLRSSFFND